MAMMVVTLKDIAEELLDERNKEIYFEYGRENLEMCFAVTPENIEIDFATNRIVVDVEGIDIMVFYVSRDRWIKKHDADMGVDYYYCDQLAITPYKGIEIE